MALGKLFCLKKKLFGEIFFLVIGITYYFQNNFQSFWADSVHGCVERHLKNALIYVPAQYLDKIKVARTKPFPFRVKFLHHDFFKDFNHVLNLDSICSGRKAGYPTVTDLRCILYTPDITILSKLNHTNELYTPVPKDRNQPSWDGLKEPHGPNTSSQRIK